MELLTKVDIDIPPFLIRHTDRVQMYGSCFVTNMGLYLQENRWNVDVNPMGVLYNPLSVIASVRRIANQQYLDANHFFENYDQYHTFTHHSSFSRPCLEGAMEAVNSRVTYSHACFEAADVLVITFGTAYVYFDKTTAEVVANCHKVPDSAFDRRLLSVQEIVSAWELLRREVRLPEKVLFTVSPIRHVRDGFHHNQLSKSVLLLAIEEIVQRSANCSYFPAYEIMMDELRDYRFYATDMCHPSPQAIEYIWMRFASTYFDESTRATLSEFERVSRSVNHRPLAPSSESYQRHLQATLDKLTVLQRKYPYCSFDADIKKIEQLRIINS